MTGNAKQQPHQDRDSYGIRKNTVGIKFHIQIWPPPSQTNDKYTHDKETAP